VKKRNSKAGLTLVEVLIAMFLVSVAAVIVYTEMLLAYRILMRSRARLEAQSVAFDHLWTLYNTLQADMPVVSTVRPPAPTPSDSMFSTSGIVDARIIVSNQPSVSAPVVHWDITVRVWAPTNSPLQMGTNPLAYYAIRRYWRHGQ